MRAYQTYLLSKPQKFDADSSAFLFADGTYLTRQRVNNTLHSILGQNYSSHRLRVGATTTAAEASLSANKIRVLGRWKSGIHRRYIWSDAQAEWTQILAQHASIQCLTPKLAPSDVSNKPDVD